ncbi:MAG: GNAT family N-acetyltransferase [Planctomycetota bacterium]|jgi:GNAT superfamily N-acetyltransferase
MGDEIRQIEPSDRAWVREFLNGHFGSTRVVSRGVLHLAGELPGFIAFYEGERAGLLTYNVGAGELEVVTLHTARSGAGLGARLLEAARAEATSLGCARMWLITTNDNRPAARFYERWGMSLVAVHRDAVTKARKLKPEIPELGVGGTPIRDEIEFEVRL